MSLINTQPIWFALGDFYNLFPQDERVYWDTFWEAYSDIVADLWGYAFQVDQAKSLFSTDPTFQRREVLVQFSNLSEGVNAQFLISNIKQDAGGRWILRGFVPRDLRTFKVGDLPEKGVIRIGVDTIPYSQVDSLTIVGGQFDGFVRESTFVLVGDPPHDYTDDPNFNDDFANQPQQLKFRINQAAGDTIVDAVLVEPNDQITVNPTGLLTLGVPGFNPEVVEYTSVIVTGDRYVFTLAPTYQAPATNPQELDFAHFIDELITVSSRDPERWSQSVTGNARWIGNGSARLVIDDQATPGPANGQLFGQYTLKPNVDFDVSVTVSLQTWPDPVPLSTYKRAYARINIGAQRLVVGVEKAKDGAGVVTDSIVFGVEGSETVTALASEPEAFEARFKRIGASLEIQYRDIDSQQFQVLSIPAVSGAASTLDLVVDDPNSESASQVVFDEVIRRTGDVIGNSRLEESFSATDTFPYTYDIDQNITSANELRDRPRTRTEFLTTTQVIEDEEAGVIFAKGDENADFEPKGVPNGGVISLSGIKIVYDSFSQNGDTFEFNVRGKIDPDVLPIDTGTTFTAETSVLQQGIGFEFSGDGKVSLANLPTRDRMWAPVAQIDERHVQKEYGVLTDLDADISTQGYLNRVQGTWFALSSGPSIQNMRSGLQLAMGLPVALTEGTVDSIDQEFDNLGRVSRYYLTVLGEDGALEHDLNPDLLPFIDFSVIVGQSVEQFQPLTNGVEVLDVIQDNDWYLNFPGVSDIERFNSFGISVAIEALSAEASYDDAVIFALRVKPTYTKMFMRFLLTSGDEDLSEDLDEDLFAAVLPSICEDITFPEGDPPEDPFATLRLGEGHKLGQAKKLGPTGYWKTKTLGYYTIQGVFREALDITLGSLTDGSTNGSNVLTSASGPFDASMVGRNILIEGFGQREITGFLSATQVEVDGSLMAAATDLDVTIGFDIVTGKGGFSSVDVEAASEGISVQGSDIFTTSGAYVFTADDVGKTIVVLDSSTTDDNRSMEITAFLNASQVRVNYTFVGDSSSLSWRLRSNIFTTDDLGKNIHIFNATDPSDNGDHKIVGIVADNQVQVLHTFSNTETDLDWELRDYNRLGGGHTLGIYDSFVCGVGSENTPDELVDSEQIVNVAMTP